MWGFAVVGETTLILLRRLGWHSREGKRAMLKLVWATSTVLQVKISLR